MYGHPSVDWRFCQCCISGGADSATQLLKKLTLAHLAWSNIRRVVFDDQWSRTGSGGLRGTGFWCSDWSRATVLRSTLKTGRG